jgi:replicative DNA helicase
VDIRTLQEESTINNRQLQLIRDPYLEASYLNAIICRNEIIREIDLPNSVFEIPTFRTVYEAMCELNADGRPVDLVLLKNKLMDKGRDLGWVLGAIKNIVFPNEGLTPGFSKFAPHYATLLREVAERREAHRVHRTYEDRLKAQETPIDELEEWRTRRLNAIHERYFDTTDENDIDAIEREWLTVIQGENLCTGFREIDEIVGRMSNGEVLTIMGRPSSGKSLFASNVLVNHLKRKKQYAVMFASLEMPARMVYERMIRQYYGTNERIIMNMAKNNGTYEFKDLAKERLLIYTKRARMRDIDSKILAWNERKPDMPIKVVAIDYLQYVRGPGEKAYERVSHVTAEVKQLAKDRNLLVLLISQVKRLNKDESEYAELTMEHARDSGTIEENADCLVGVSRIKGEPEKRRFKSLKVRSGGTRSQVRDLALDLDCIAFESEEREPEQRTYI